MSLSAPAQTPVVFPVRDLTGLPGNRLITVTPLDGPIVYGSNIYYGGPITLSTADGVARTNLIGGNYRLTFQGLPKSVNIFVPFGLTNTVSAADPNIQRGGIYQVWVVNPAPGSNVSWTVVNGTNLFNADVSHGEVAVAAGSALSAASNYVNQVGTAGSNNVSAGIAPLATTQALAAAVAPLLSTNGNAGGLTNLAWGTSRPALLAAAAAGEYQLVSISYNAQSVPTNALVLWPDGTYGVWMATNIHPLWLTADGYTLTYTNAGVTMAQPAMSRDANGNITNVPPLMIFP